jgi:hypothetical protein
LFFTSIGFSGRANVFFLSGLSPVQLKRLFPAFPAVHDFSAFGAHQGIVIDSGQALFFQVASSAMIYVQGHKVSIS